MKAIAKISIFDKKLLAGKLVRKGNDRAAVHPLPRLRAIELCRSCDDKKTSWVLKRNFIYVERLSFLDVEILNSMFDGAEKTNQAGYVIEDQKSLIVIEDGVDKGFTASCLDRACGPRKGWAFANLAQIDCGTIGLVSSGIAENRNTLNAALKTSDRFLTAR
jgi:hypothetical protein